MKQLLSYVLVAIKFSILIQRKCGIEVAAPLLWEFLEIAFTRQGNVQQSSNHEAEAQIEAFLKAIHEAMLRYEVTLDHTNEDIFDWMDRFLGNYSIPKIVEKKTPENNIDIIKKAKLKLLEALRDASDSAFDDLRREINTDFKPEDDSARIAFKKANDTPEMKVVKGFGTNPPTDKVYGGETDEGMLEQWANFLNLITPKS